MRQVKILIKDKNFQNNLEIIKALSDYDRWWFELTDLIECGFNRNDLLIRKMKSNTNILPASDQCWEKTFYEGFTLTINFYDNPLSISLSRNGLNEEQAELENKNRKR